MVKLPEIMERNRKALSNLRIPVPTQDIGITMDATPSMIAEKMLEVGGILAFLEYTLGMAEAAHLVAKDSVEYALTLGIVGMDPKGTIKGREAVLIDRSPALQSDISYRTTQNALVEQFKGLRNAYRAQYDVLSRVLSAKQLEAEVARS